MSLKLEMLEVLSLELYKFLKEYMYVHLEWHQITCGSFRRFLPYEVKVLQLALQTQLL